MAWKNIRTIIKFILYPFCDCDEAATGWEELDGTPMGDTGETKIAERHLKLDVSLRHALHLLDKTLEGSFEFVSQLTLSLSEKNVFKNNYNSNNNNCSVL